MIEPIRLAASYVALMGALLLVACAADSTVGGGERCTTDRDCAEGVCQGGFCRVLGNGGSGDSGLSDQNAGDVGDDSASPDLVDAGPDNGPAVDVFDDFVDRNDCGGTGPLQGQPGASCGICDDGQWACDGDEAVTCEGASETNLCGGCGPLPGLPGSECDECNGGLWVCDGTSLACDCEAEEPDGTCQNPFPIEQGDVELFSLCGAGDDEDPVRGELDCRDVNVRGEDVVFRLVLAERAAFEIDLRDDDDEGAVDTVVYVRDNCADDESQLLCSDDVACEDSDIEIGACINDRQVRQSTMTVELEPGTYFIVADSFSYTAGAGSFACGDVRLEVTESLE